MVVQTGIPQLFTMVWGVSPAAFPTMDCGKSRSSADALAICGEVNAKSKAAALQWIEKYRAMLRNKQTELGAIYAKTSPSHALELNERYADFSIQFDHKKHRLGCGVILNVSNYIFSKIDPELASDFMHKVVTGENLTVRDPEYLLRNRLLANQLAKASLSSAYIFALFIKAWNARRSGVVLKTLRYRETGSAVERFPVAI